MCLERSSQISLENLKFLEGSGGKRGRRDTMDGEEKKGTLISSHCFHLGIPTCREYQGSTKARQEKCSNFAVLRRKGGGEDDLDGLAAFDATQSIICV